MNWWRTKMFTAVLISKNWRSSDVYLLIVLKTGIGGLVILTNNNFKIFFTLFPSCSFYIFVSFSHVTQRQYLEPPNRLMWSSGFYICVRGGVSASQCTVTMNVHDPRCIDALQILVITTIFFPLSHYCPLMSVRTSLLENSVSAYQHIEFAA